MGQTQEGARKVAAKKAGVEVDEYIARVEGNEKWCTGCRQWHPQEAFNRDGSRWDGLSPSCREYKNRHGRETYHLRPKPAAGRRYVAARNGDQKQAERRVNHLVAIGKLPSPKDLPCTDCGHLGPDRLHDYDHHLGYAPEHHEDVQAVCRSCHSRRQWRNKKSG